MWYRKRHVAEKFRYHIGNTDTTSVFSDTTSVFSDTTSLFPMWYRKKPMWYRYFRCGIGIFPLRAFPIPHRKLFLTVWKSLCKFISMDEFLFGFTYIYQRNYYTTKTFKWPSRASVCSPCICPLNHCRKYSPNDVNTLK
jgi:hypothetical protein